MSAENREEETVQEDDHYYVAGYSAEDDPYVYANGVLINHFNIQDTKDLNEIEAEISAIGIVELLKEGPPVSFNTETLKRIHRIIFQEIYPWAGEFRKVDIAKRDTIFLGNEQIKSHLDALFEGAAKASFFVGLTQKEFAKNAADFLLKLNLIHPFREGNGRSQRLLLSWMAMNAGHDIQWSGVSSSAMCAACIEGEQGNPAKMVSLLSVYLAPLENNDEKSPLSQPKVKR